MRRKHGIKTLLFMATAVPIAVAVYGQDPAIVRHTIDGGGVMRSTGGDLELSGTIGQPDVGVLTGQNVEVIGGFWFPVLPGDCNTDGGVGLVDYDDWMTCLSGPNDRLSGTCSCFDFDGDGDVDLFDASEFQAFFIGD